MQSLLRQMGYIIVCVFVCKNSNQLYFMGWETELFRTERWEIKVHFRNRFLVVLKTKYSFVYLSGGYWGGDDDVTGDWTETRTMQ